MEIKANVHLKGLTSNEVLASRAKDGRNEVPRSSRSSFQVLLNLVKEPMVLLLLSAACLYFISGAVGDGLFMVFAIMVVTGISLFQEYRSGHALEALRKLTQPTCRVIRNGELNTITREDIVIGDFVMVEEGGSVPADGSIVHANDFAVNESILTGESLPVFKNNLDKNNKVFQGTTVAGGLAIFQVQAIGVQTSLGKIGKSLEDIKEEATPLQKQIRNFVVRMAIVGGIFFFIVWAFNFFKTHNLFESLLQALTLAMSILPEEIPVAFTTFMALGAWRLLKLGVIVKNTATVEALGSATVICIDKTGTITENQMTLASVFALASGKTTAANDSQGDQQEVIHLAMWASEPIPFDPMEISLHQTYGKQTLTDERLSFRMIHEYPLAGKPPMMTHIFENSSGKRIIAAKGAPEAMIAVSHLSDTDKKRVLEATRTLGSSGFRVLGVGESDFSGSDFPEKQQNLPFVFKGLVAFYDPPKKNISEVLQAFYAAGIQVKIITGDNAVTTSNIAQQINFRGYEKALTGEELVTMKDDEVRKAVLDVNIFVRMFPDAKWRIVNALKEEGHVVAMTGDGVNDGPALKAAHISVAMGKKGSEMAKEVSSLVLTDDDLSRMVDAIALGRKIYSNLKKAIQYIISIHIPIILTVFIPLTLGWVYPDIFTPLHVIFFEIIMGPTCSIIYENEPMEKNAMLQKPRPLTTTFFSWPELRTSLFQGLVITLGTLSVYQYAVYGGAGEDLTRTMVFMTLLVANITLTFVNRSFYYSLLISLRYKNDLILFIVIITLALAGIVLYVPPITRFFKFETPAFYNLIPCLVVGIFSVVWFEGVKYFKRIGKG